MVVKIEISLEVYLLEPNKRCNEVPRSRAAGYPILKKLSSPLMPACAKPRLPEPRAAGRRFGEGRGED